MKTFSFKEFAVPMIIALDHYNYMHRSHYKRVSILSYYIGKELQLSDAEIFSLVVAASIHDCGVLKMSNQEDLVKQEIFAPLPHSEIGASLMSSVSSLQNAAKIVKYHHTNYCEEPNIKEEIPLASHIIHLADTVELLVPSDNHTKEDIDNIIKRLRKDLGSKYHPNVYDAFINIAKMRELWESYKYLNFDELFDKIQSSHAFIFTTNDVLELSRFLSKLVDFRSTHTIAHSCTVSALANFIAEKINFSQDQRTKIQVAGFVHDIGKLAISPDILEKRSELTPQENNTMKLHAFYTVRVLGRLNKVEWCQDIIRWAERHHERSDGSGYPFSLGEASLDDGCIILAFADAITELLEQRGQRAALSIDEAFHIVERDTSDKLSTEIFTIIKQYKSQIKDLVVTCQQQMIEEYEQIVKKTVVQSSK